MTRLRLANKLAQDKIRDAGLFEERCSPTMLNDGDMRNMSSSRRKPVPSKSAPVAYQNIEFLIANHGEITIGRIDSIPCVATAADEDQCLAVLQRRPGESLTDLLRRLDAAIEDAYENDIYIDEVNEPPNR